MAIEFGKGIALAGGFDLGAKAPLDSRLTVATIEERDAHVTGNRAYEGMLVYVEADKITYQYIADADGNLTWKEFGFTETDFLVHIADNLTTEDAGKVLSANQGVVLKGMIDAEATAREEADDMLQANIDKLDAYIGDIPSDYTETNIVAYINKKAEETLTSATGGSSESAASVKAQLDTYKSDNDARVQAVEGDVADLEAAIAAEQGRAEGVESGLETRLKAVEDDHLTSADRTALEQSIQTNANAIELLTNGVSADEVDGVNDLINYVKDHGTEVTGMQEDIVENAEAISGVAGRMTTAEGKITAVEGAVATKVEQEAYDAKIAELAGADSAMSGKIAALEALMGEGNETVADQIADAVATEKAEREAAIALKADKTEVEAVSGKVTTLETDMAQAKTDIDNVEVAVATKAEQADLEAEAAAREALDARVVVVEGKSHTHTNADELAKIVDGDVAKWNSISDNMTEYVDNEINKIEAIIGDIDADKTVVQLLADMRAECEANETAAVAAAQQYTDGKIAAVNTTIGTVAEGKTVVKMIEEAAAAAEATAAADATSKANAAESAAKGHATALDEAMGVRVASLETASATHALASDLTALTNRVATAEGKVSTLETEMDAVEAKALANEGAINTINTNLDKKADQTALDNAVGRIAELEDWQSNFAEITESEINDLFA